jgi:putative membrane protein
VANFIIKVAVGAVALWVAALLVPGVGYGPDPTFGSRFATLILVALIFGVVNAVLKPIATFFSFPFIILTLGLFTIVVNAFMLQITEWIAEPLGLSFTIDQFWWDAIWAAIIISIVTIVANLILPDND